MENSASILVVDDDPERLLIRDRVLSLAGYRVAAAGGGSEALALLSSEPFDLVVCDAVMPDMDGMELCRRIRAGGQTARLPVLLLVPHRVDSQMTLEGVTAADGYLQVPVDPSLLCATAARLIERRRVEDAFREGEAKYRMLMEEASDGIHTYDWGGRFVEVNHKLCEMLGYSRAELLRMRVQDLIPPDDLTSRPIRFAELRAGRTVISERRLVRKGGSLFPAEISGKMLSGGLLQAIVRDVSERKRAEGRVREAERLAALTLDALAEHIAVLDDAGTVIATNKAWRDFASESGAEPEEVCEGTNYFGVCERAAARGCEEALLFARGVRAVIGGEAPQFTLEYPLRTPSEVLWFVARVTRFHGGGAARFAVAHENITAQKLTEEKLRSSEEWLRSIFKASRDGILIEDAEHINYVNDAYVRLFGYDHPGELIGKHVSVVLSGEDEERMLEFGRRRARGDAAPSAYEFRGKRKDGEALDLEASVSTSMVAGKAYVTTMVREISERKRAEKALRKAHEKLEGRVAERTAELVEINVKLRQEIAEREQAEEARRDLMRRLVAAQEDERRRISRELHDQTGQRLTALIIELKSLEGAARIDPDVRARLQSLREAANDLGRDVHALAWGLRPSALDDFGLDVALRNYAEDWSRRAGVPVDFQSTGFGRGRLPPAVETTLYRVVQEALTNVFRHARARRVSVILESRRGHARVVIEDDGCGFEAAIITRPPLSPRAMGLLGMRERMQLLDGTIEIESAPGRGTAVFAHVPVPESREGVRE